MQSLQSYKKTILLNDVLLAISMFLDVLNEVVSIKSVKEYNTLADFWVVAAHKSSFKSWFKFGLNHMNSTHNPFCNAQTGCLYNCSNCPGSSGKIMSADYYYPVGGPYSPKGTPHCEITDAYSYIWTLNTRDISFWELLGLLHFQQDIQEILREEGVKGL